MEMSNFTPIKKKRLSFCIAAVALVCNLSASHDWQVATINVPTIVNGIGGSYTGGSTSTGLSKPSGIVASYNAGSAVSNLYVADSLRNMIFRGSLSGTTTGADGNLHGGSYGDFGIYAGTGSRGCQNGDRTSATFNEPQGLAIKDGYLYIADSESDKIRRIQFSTGQVDTFAGSSEGMADGRPGRFDTPMDVDVTSGTSTYVADADNDAIRSVDSSGNVTTMPAFTGMTLEEPRALSYDSANNRLYVATGVTATGTTTQRILKINTATGVQDTFNAAPTGGWGHVTGLQYDSGKGSLYVVDSSRNTVYEVTSAGVVNAIAGSTTQSGHVDGTGDVATFTNPVMITLAPNGKLYLTEDGHIRELTYMGTGTGPTPSPGPNPNPNDPNDPSRGTARSSASARSSSAASKATEDDGDATDEASFRFALNTDSMKLSMRATNSSVGGMETNNVYNKTLSDFEKSLDAVQGIRQDGQKTFWMSGLYDQGKLDAMLGNPAAKEHHWGVIVGGHYKDLKTNQIFGVAVDVGVSDSIADTDKDMKTDVKMAQLTFYYNKIFLKDWKFNIHASYMRALDRHQRPVSTNSGKQIAIGNGVSHEFALSGEFNYKYRIDGRNDHYFKPFVGWHYAYDLQEAFEEQNVGRFNKRFEKAKGDQLGLVFGIKANLSYKINDTKSLVVLPKLTYTRYLKMLRLKQWSYNISTGVGSTATSGTPGRDLLSPSIGFGINDSESQTSWKVAYTGNIQEHRKSHEVMVDFGIKF